MDWRSERAAVGRRCRRPERGWEVHSGGKSAVGGAQFETTLAGRSTPKRLRWLTAQGYRSQTIFLWLPTPQMAIDRLRARHLADGHDVPPKTIIRRYHAGLVNFRNLLRPIADNWRVYDNAGSEPRLIAFGRRMTKKRVKDVEAWRRFNARSPSADDTDDR